MAFGPCSQGCEILACGIPYTRPVTKKKCISVVSFVAQSLFIEMEAGSQPIQVHSTEHLYIIDRGPLLGRNMFTGEFGGGVCITFRASNPSDRSGPEWGTLANSISYYYRHYEYEVIRWYDYVEWLEEQGQEVSPELQEIVSLPLRPPTPFRVEAPTALGKQSTFPTCAEPAVHALFTEDFPLEVIAHGEVQHA